MCKEARANSRGLVFLSSLFVLFVFHLGERLERPWAHRGATREAGDNLGDVRSGLGACSETCEEGAIQGGWRVEGGEGAAVDAVNGPNSATGCTRGSDSRIRRSVRSKSLACSRVTAVPSSIKWVQPTSIPRRHFLAHLLPVLSLWILYTVGSSCSPTTAILFFAYAAFPLVFKTAVRQDLHEPTVYT